MSSCLKFKFDVSTSCIILGILFVLQKTVLFSESVVLSNLLDILQWPFLLHISINMVDVKIKRKEIIRYIIACAIFIMFFFSYMNSGLANIFKYAILMVGLRRNKNYELFRKFRNVYTIIVVSIFTLGLLRIIPSAIVRRGYFTFGFIHSNVLAMLILSIVCCDIICNYNKSFRNRAIIYLFIAIVCIVLTNSRSVLIGFISVVFFYAFFKRIKNKNISNIMKFLLTALPVTFTILSFYLAYNYDAGNPVFLLLNKISSERIFLANELTRWFSLTLFGQECSIALMENSYLTVFFAWGIIPGLISIAIYSYGICKTISKKEYGVAISLLSFSIQGLFEGSAFELFINLALLAIFM